MDEKDRAKLIRTGNECFRNGEYKEAARIFIKTRYSDGLIRMGDFYYYEKQDVAAALKFYKAANYQPGVAVLIEKIVPVIRKWLKEDEQV